MLLDVYIARFELYTYIAACIQTYLLDFSHTHSPQFAQGGAGAFVHVTWSQMLWDMTSSLFLIYRVNQCKSDLGLKFLKLTRKTSVK